MLCIGHKYRNRGIISWKLYAPAFKNYFSSPLLNLKYILMKQPDALNQVAEFHTTFRHPILPSPAIPDETRCKLRVALIAEELKELEVAILEKDIVEVADALCDIQYVLSGAILEFGLGNKFKDLFDEVQRSNMSKACQSEAEAKQTVEHYMKKDGTECYYEKKEDKWLVYRKSDNKTIKSINYSPADLEGILNKG
jgi:predicted HAD superfamily Cof-like phosphohydrolase